MAGKGDEVKSSTDKIIENNRNSVVDRSWPGILLDDNFINGIRDLLEQSVEEAYPDTQANVENSTKDLSNLDGQIFLTVYYRR